MIGFDTLTKLAEGKTKIIYENPADPSTVYMVFKDDITAGDGLKHDIMGESFDKLMDKFEAIARITGQFKNLSVQ